MVMSIPVADPDIGVVPEGVATLGVVPPGEKTMAGPGVRLEPDGVYGEMVTRNERLNIHWESRQWLCPQV